VLEQRAQLNLDRFHFPRQAPAVVMLSERVPNREQLADQLKTRLAELLLGGESLAVKAEVALQMTPTCLALLGVEKAIRPPAIRGHDSLKLG